MENYLKREFYCIQYPAVVNNVDKAVETLGGLSFISKIMFERDRRLELKFRPKDPYCKTAYSNMYDNKDILIKVVVKKKKKNGVVVSSSVSTEFMGIVSTMHKFETMMDYQYLPAVPVNDRPEPSNRLQCAIDLLVPKGLPDVDWLDQPAPPFFIPRFFSRMDNPQNYAFRTNTSVNTEDSSVSDLVVRTRKKRITHAIYVTFNHNESVPEKPDEYALGLLNATKKEFETVKQLFESQPIWSKNAILHKTKIKSAALKTICPCLAYFYVSGPWRLLWVRFGYDPRKDFHSRIYQLLEFRQKKIYSSIVNREKMPRFTFNMKSKINTNRKRTYGAQREFDCEDTMFFKPGSIPPFSNMYYQYCNIKIPEIEEMLEKLGDVHPGALCHEKRGWLPVAFDEQCREIMNGYLMDKMREIVIEHKFKVGDLESTMGETVDEDMTIDDVEGEDDVEDAPSEYEYDDIDDEYDESVLQDTTDVDIGNSKS